MSEIMAIPISGYGDLSLIGEAIAKSGMFGPCTSAKGLVIATVCHQEGLSLREFLATYHVSDIGQIMMRTDAMQAKFEAAGGKIKWIQFSDDVAEAIFRYGDHEINISITIDQAKKAGWVKAKSAWESTPDAMLRARLVSKAVRMIAPAIIAGHYTPEEMPETSQHPKVAPRRAAEKVIEAEEVTVSAPPCAEVDPAICPIDGKLFGKPWHGMPVKVLTSALDYVGHGMTETHKDYVQDLLASMVEANK